MPTLFISHSSQDDKIVSLIHDTLELAGFDTWVDHENGGIDPGDRWRAAIRDAINACDVGIFVLTPDSVASKYCENEWGRIQDLKKRLFILEFNPVQLADMPLEFGEIQKIDISGGNFLTGMNDLAQTLHAYFPPKPEAYEATMTNRNLGDIDKAIDHYKQSLVIAHDIGDYSGESMILVNLGIAYRDLGESNKAIDHYEQALSIAHNIGNSSAESLTLVHLGIAYRDLDDNDKAIDYYQQALTIARKTGDWRNERLSLLHLGHTCRDMDEAHRAVDYYEQALTIAREIGDRNDENRCLLHLGIVYRDLGEANKAIDHYEQALAIAREIGDRSGESAILVNLGIAYRELKG
ncbi:tetratricopeptide repeat protein [Chloroflexota bacterium]